MENKFISRKTKRKMKRQEKKQNKNSFYTEKFGNQDIQPKNKVKNVTENDLFRKRSQNKKTFIQQIQKEIDEDDDEEIESENSVIDSENGDGDNKNVKYENKNEDYNENENQNNNDNGNDKNEIDKEIKQLEKKLGIIDSKKFNSFKKRVALENYDEDLFDFLDGIDHYVQEKKSSTNPSNLQTNNKKSIGKSLKGKKQTTQTTETVKEEEVPLSLDEIKSKSKLFANSKMTLDDQLKISFLKDITSLLNKISEANLNLMLPEFLEKIDSFLSQTKSENKLLLVYENISKISLRLMLDPSITNLPITSCISTYICILHYKFGNSFLLYFLKTLFEKLEENLNSYNTPDFNKSSLKNFVFIIIQFYIYGNLTSKIYFDVIKYFIENFNDTYSEILLILLSYIGIELRKENPESLKEIISSVTKKYNVMKINKEEQVSSKMKFIVDMIDDIKNNKYLKFNLSERFNFFKNVVNINKKNFVSVSDLKSSKIADKIDVSWEMLKNFDKNKIQDILEDNKNQNINQVLIEGSGNDFMNEGDVNTNNNLIQKKLKKYKMTTDLKKMIFTSIVTSSDCNDAFEKLLRLNLKKDQAREIVKILVLLVIEEKAYNPFYKLVMEKLMNVEKSHKYTFHYTIWDYIKILDNYDLKYIICMLNLF